MDKYFVIGQMSGTSLDGVDLAYCCFEKKDQWTYEIIHAKTYPYSLEWRNRLAKSMELSGRDLIKLHNEYGILLGNLINKFVDEFGIKKVSFIASHGHTVFHQPGLNICLQIGNGAFLSATAKITTVCDFRTTDIALGGQGAPLVPLGDKYLFAQYDYCLNLGGFANVSLDDNVIRKAFDICPVNIVCNQLARDKGMDYDYNGNLAKNGNLIPELYDNLNKISYYSQLPPKSLAKEWVDIEMMPLINVHRKNIEDTLFTFLNHAAFQIAGTIDKHGKRVLVTGGGAYNQTLIELLQQKSKSEIVIPDEHTINFKEALIFAFLGVLRMREEVNCLKSVTGALQDNIGGTVYLMN